MILANSPQVMGSLALNPDWHPIEAPPGPGWTDDYINLPRALWEGLSGVETCRIYPYLKQCQAATGANAEPTPDAQPSP
jgi:hypothetical protein